MHARNLNLKMSFALCAVTSEAAKRDRDKGMKGIIAASEIAATSAARIITAAAAARRQSVV